MGGTEVPGGICTRIKLVWAKLEEWIDASRLFLAVLFFLKKFTFFHNVYKIVASLEVIYHSRLEIWIFVFPPLICILKEHKNINKILSWQGMIS